MEAKGRLNNHRHAFLLFLFFYVNSCHQFQTKMKKLNYLTLLLILTFIFQACKTNTEQKESEVEEKHTSITQKTWGTADGLDVSLFTLTNANSNEVTITNYGGIITSWTAPDRSGTRANIVLGFNSLDEYVNSPHPYFGAIIGRYGNRIAKGKFTLEGQTYSLAVNNGQNHLHGGLKGFDKVVWNAQVDTSSSPAKLKLTYLSKDGEEGYPGNLNITVTYSLTDDDELIIEYDAETDKTTHCNLTNHSYFNLTGNYSNPILDHSLTIYADRYTPVDDGLIPTGKLKEVKGTPFDFTTSHKIGERIGQVPGGYDHNFVLNRQDNSLMLAAVLYDSASGRKIETYTMEPGVQFYSGNFLDGTLISSSGTPFNKHTGLCLETQHFPDTPNQSAFPTTILKPGEKYHTVTRYKFSVE